MKICNTCKLEKHESEFYIRKDKSPNKNGQPVLKGSCKKCEAKRLRIYRKDNPDAEARHKANYFQKKRKINLGFFIWKGAKARAKKNQLEFSINVEDIIIPEFCPILGIKLNHFNNKASNDSPSLDRINTNLGYIKNNIEVISWRANHVKNNGTIEEHEKIASYMRKKSVDKL